MDNEQIETIRRQEFDDQKLPPELMQNVRPEIKAAVGIPESEPAVLMYHLTSRNVGERVMDEGFVNVVRRGTLAPITDYEIVANIMSMQSAIHGTKGVTLITFCLPASRVVRDPNKYGWTVNTPLPPDAPPHLIEHYNKIAVRYDPNTGLPKEYAGDQPDLYPIYISPNSIVGVATIN